MAKFSEHGIRLSSMSPSFLNSNSTSHTWPFSAVAELTDNASDPGVSAKQLWIDVVEEAGRLCLIFTDNGSGMTPKKLHNMLSFGFTEKGSGKASQQAIGVYGNGFKSGSMRLGRDALIFTKNGGCQTVGMLSQTYLEKIKAQAVIVPIVPFNQQTMLQSLVVTEDSEASLAAILQHSIVSSQEQIHAHFDSIPSKKGTKILIWNIRRTKDGGPEIDFETDGSDFRLPEIQIEELNKGPRSGGSLRAELNIPEMRYSLRAYLSILYLKPRTQIILRGKMIIARLVSNRLAHIEHDVYKPHFSKEKVKVTFGLNLKSKDHYGIMMYHRNRLIKAHEKVGCQLKTSGKSVGVGVIGIIECNFLKPAHNKQDFEYTKEYRLTLGALGIKLKEYLKEVMEKKTKQREVQAVDREENEAKHGADESPMWLQCKECLKWRSVPARHYNGFPESWDCSQNPNPRYGSCSSREETEDSEELLGPSYQKNYKKQELPKSRKREKSVGVCEFREQVTEHATLSRSASEPTRPTLQSSQAHDRCHAEENTFERGQATAHHPTDHLTDTHEEGEGTRERNSAMAGFSPTEQKLVERDTVIKVKTQITRGWLNVENKANSQSQGSAGKKKDARVVPVETQKDNTDSLSHKRKPGILVNGLKKKLCLWKERQPGSEKMAEETGPEKETRETFSTQRMEQHRSSQPCDTPQGTPSSLTWSHAVPPAQTLMVSPLSRAEGPQDTQLSLGTSDRVATLQKLAGLEREVRGLRRRLGLEVTSTSRGTMTPAGSLLPASMASREIGCQTDVAESSASSSSPAQTLLIQGQIAGCGRREQSEQNAPWSEKSDSRNTMRVYDGEACEGSRLVEENLRGIRYNMVVLLTALLPQLDLAGISVENTDVDNILQQIIEVNSLKP